MKNSRILGRFIRGMRTLTGAGCATLYLPGSNSRMDGPTLLHEGELDPVPELVDQESAHQFVSDLGPIDMFSSGGTTVLCLPSASPDGGLIPLPADEMSWCRPEASAEKPGRRRRDTEAERSAEPGAWLGLRMPSGQRPVVDCLNLSNPMTAMQGEAEPAVWWNWLFSLGGALASHDMQASGILKDPITGLADRREFQGLLSLEMARARDESLPLTVLMINPNHFFEVNDRLGRELGDRCVAEISDRLCETLRGDDLVARYGGVIFTAILPDTPLDEAQEITLRLLHRLATEPYLDDVLQLEFSIGFSTGLPAQESPAHPWELIQQCDRALSAAKKAGGNKVVAWADSEVEEANGLDRLSGIFTGNLDKDYRNMVLLWDTVNVIALDPDFDELVEQLMSRLYDAFKPLRVGLFSRSIDDELNLIRGYSRSSSGSGPTTPTAVLDLNPKQEKLVRLALSEGVAQEACLDDSGISTRCCAVPLMTGNDCLGSLYLDGRVDTLNLEASDLVFFRALGSQVATAMDRARTAELEARRQDYEKRMLRAELQELRQALQQAKLVFRSPQMETLVTTAHRVAPTDATVLITGESGTGKELVARTVHELSSRQGQPFVIVDCGSIPSTLIESELFGSEKGAYTGAQTRRMGRLAEANYGSVLLDEIGEVPLEVQVKLLRFVQEKQFTRVGGTRQQKVDVRILAATNRDLKAEVAAGRFREDLYYRLHVIHLAVPPLRDRPDDILHLANHFLELYSAQYQKNVRRLSSAAATAVVQYSWPGNVRELQNRIMQAVILCEGDQLGPDDFGLATSSLDAELQANRGLPDDPTSVSRDLVAEPADRFTEGVKDPNSVSTAIASTPPLKDFDSALRHMREGLSHLIEAASNGLSPSLLPIGRWLDEDLLLAADEAAAAVARRAATILGLAETTYRRRLQKAKDRLYAGLSPRVAEWEDVKPALETMVQVDRRDDADLVRQTQTVLLEEILVRFPQDVRTGATLLAVTAPTFRRRVAELDRVEAGTDLGPEQPPSNLPEPEPEPAYDW